MIKREAIYSIVIHAAVEVGIDTMRTSLAAIGYPVRVVNNETDTHMLVGCYKNLSEASPLLLDLQEHNIDCELITLA